ncbi:unnamed protein product [Prunus armeniaca]
MGLEKWGSVGENDGDRVCWKKKSKFFDLDIIGTLLEIPGKNKDEIAARALEFVKSREESDSRLLGLKSHDCHTLMQQLLPMAIRSVLEKPARYMKVLKGYVQNRTHLEGCIAEQCLQARRWEFRSHYQVAQ